MTPIDFAQANAFVATYHRHHKPMPGCKFSIAVSDKEGKVRGVAMVGRPVSRMLDDGWTLEVNRCCTDGARNACSMMYAAAWKVARGMGYRRLVTYTMPEEGGASLRATGWKEIQNMGGGAKDWNSKSRTRDVNVVVDGKAKTRWEVLSGELPKDPPPSIDKKQLEAGQDRLFA